MQEDVLTGEQALFELGSGASFPFQEQPENPENSRKGSGRIDRLLNHLIIEKYLKDCRELPVLDKDEEKRLFEEYVQTRDPELRSRLIRHNLRLVVAIAKRTSHIPSELMDMIQNGNMGLFVAVEKFDPKTGNAFSTYATWWIRQSIYRCFEKTGRTIRVPTHMSTEVWKLSKLVRSFEKTHGRTPSDDEIMTMWGYTKVTLKKIRRVEDIGHEVSLSQPVKLSDKTNGGLSLESHLSVSHKGHQISIEARAELETALEEVEQFKQIVRGVSPDYQADRLFCLFGIDDDTFERKLPEVVGVKYGVSRQRICQHEEEILRRLKMKRGEVLRLLEKVTLLRELVSTL